MTLHDDLFNSKTIERLCNDVKLTTRQKQAAKEWLDMLELEQLKKEKGHYIDFAVIVLRDILGYSIKTTQGMAHEEGNVEFVFSNNENKQVICIEAKGSTQDLFSPQHRKNKEHETPIKQTWDYMGSIGLDYGICTNYKDFVLITKQFGYSKYYFFDFNSIKKNPDRLKEFIGIFSRERIIEQGFVEKLYKKSIEEEREFTNEFYKLFHETRLMMIMSFEKNGASKNESIYYTQLFLNRLIFIFFVEDRGFIPDKQLFTNRILKILDSGQCTEHSKKIYDDIKELFIAFDKGSRVLGVFGFNGGLFSGVMPEKIYFSDLKNPSFFNDVKQNSQLSKSTKLNERASKIIEKNPDLNLIISNLLIMDSFDFNTEVNVNILGHIFEQSISDLEELKEEGISRRKKEAIYYTPEYITDYICRNTIIPYLSKSGVNTTHELIKEYKDLEELEKKFKEIKILDPACGSGAFLVKSIDILLEIHKEIQSKKKNNKIRSLDQLQITEEWDEDKEIRDIIEKNIYGVDINRESIEITQLSLFLKLASNERKLMYLGNYIKVGNSLIDDKNIDPRAFSWEDEFPEILGTLIEDKGFDIILGNPPYGAELTEIEKEYLNKKFQIGSTDTAQLMMKRSHDLLKSGGCHGFIVPKALIYASNWETIRSHILSELKILLDVGKVWKEVKLEQSIYIIQKDKITDFYLNGVRKGEYLNVEYEVEKKYVDLFEFFLSNVTKEELDLGEKIFKNSERLNKFVSNSRGSIYQKLVKEKGEISVMGGKQVQRFHMDGIYGYIDAKYIDEEKAHVTTNSILVQRLVAHILNPVDHIKITATIPNKDDFIIVDTINQLKITDTNISSYYILGLLNSKINNWYAYRFIYGKAIRTMQFDNPVTDRIPIVIDKQENVTSCVKQLLFLHKKLLDVQQKFTTTVKTTLNLEKLDNKILNIQELKFDEFSNSISKLTKKKLSPKENAQWVEYFDEEKNNAVEIMKKITYNENELNQLFYDIFKLTEDEINLIESSTPE